MLSDTAHPSHDAASIKADNSAKLARMATQIALFFQSYPEEQAEIAIAAHINEFWSRHMREAFRCAFDAGSEDLHPLVRRALPRIKGAGG